MGDGVIFCISRGWTSGQLLHFTRLDLSLAFAFQDAESQATGIVCSTGIQYMKIILKPTAGE